MQTTRIEGRLDLETVFNAEAVDFAARMRHQPPRVPYDLPLDWRVEFEERAAIKEYLANMSREEAETQAFQEILHTLFNRAGLNPLDGLSASGYHQQHEEGTPQGDGRGIEGNG